MKTKLILPRRRSSDRSDEKEKVGDKKCLNRNGVVYAMVKFQSLIAKEASLLLGHPEHLFTRHYALQRYDSKADGKEMKQ